VKDIHIWGSWLNDEKDPNYATGSQLHVDLWIFDDVPAGTGGVQYSRPGALLWNLHFHPWEHSARLWTQVSGEDFYDPRVDQIIGTDNEIWQYNFVIPDGQEFTQEEGKIYWLGITKRNEGDHTNIFGWKTSTDAFMDDAVYGTGAPDEWVDIVYPDGHRYERESVNLAFVITPEPATLCLIGLGGLGLLWRRRK